MTESKSPLRRVTTALLALAAVVAAGAFPAAYALDRTAGREVVILAAAFDAVRVQDNRDQFDDSIADPAARREAVVEIYGSTPTAQTSRVLFVDDAELIRPAEDASLLLLPPASGGDHRIQAKSAYFVAKMATIGAVAALVALLVARRFVK